MCPILVFRISSISSLSSISIHICILHLRSGSYPIHSDSFALSNHPNNTCTGTHAHTHAHTHTNTLARVRTHTLISLNQVFDQFGVFFLVFCYAVHVQLVRATTTNTIAPSHRIHSIRCWTAGRRRSCTIKPITIINTLHTRTRAHKNKNTRVCFAVSGSVRPSVCACA